MASKKYYETRAFKEAQKHWYGKLEKEGFNDIEYTDFETGEVGNLLRSKTVRSVAELSRNRFRFESDRDYFRWAGQFYWYIVDEGYDQYDCEMWQMWANGSSVSQIHRIMGRSRKAVTKTIKGLNLDMRRWVESGLDED